MTNDEKRQKYCGGCYNDFYNHRVNFDGKSECWSLKGSKVTKVAFVHLEQRPPWHVPIVTTLDCHQKQRYVRIKPGHEQLVTKP